MFLFCDLLIGTLVYYLIWAATKTIAAICNAGTWEMFKVAKYFLTLE
jgi:hypothetical protein